jgi:hypothetical protein
MFASGAMNIYGDAYADNKSDITKYSARSHALSGLSNNCDKIICCVLKAVGNSDQQ